MSRSAAGCSPRARTAGTRSSLPPPFSARTAGTGFLWPVFVALAHAAGYVGAYAFPLRVRDQAVGVLNVLTTTTGTPTEQDTVLLQALADVAAVALVQWTAEPLRPTDIVTRIQATVSSKAATDTAAGMLAAAGSLTVQEAARALRRYSGIHQRRTTDVARALIHRELSPESVLEDGR
ncbi:ANTAR domain-containing protein [Streptomyces sp. NPDC048404]|uniref:ANTAR domain-containing protein n=1 Tax=unclassified Streptomyces TaxID=2593676 RepID=UPI00343410A1